VDDVRIDSTLGRLREQVGGNPSGAAMLFWPSLLMTGDMWAAQADYFGTDRRGGPGRPAGPRRQ
jgi:3-oxoadipate enol-lactonase